MPRPISAQDVDRLEEIYVDESSQTNHRFLIIGGIIIPHRLSEQFTKDILKARRPRLAAERSDSDELRELKWSEVRKGYFDAYKRVVDAFFDFETYHIKDTSKEAVEFHCRAVLTHIRGRRFNGDRGRVAYNKEVFAHLFNVVNYHKSSLFHIYFDRMHTSDIQSVSYAASLRKRLRSLRIKVGDRRDNPVRKVQARHSHEVQALQISDLLIGAIAFRLNRQYDKPDANPDKRLLCDYIFERTGLSSHIIPERRVFRPKEYGRYQLKIARKKEAQENPPNDW